jgi:hypothetical protein
LFEVRKDTSNEMGEHCDIVNNLKEKAVEVGEGNNERKNREGPARRDSSRYYATK